MLTTAAGHPRTHDDAHEDANADAEDVADLDAERHPVRRLP